MRMKKIFYYIYSPLLLLHTLHASAQKNADPVKQRIAIFAPLYLDSAFDASGNYKFADGLPKYISPGLEFYEGVQLAVDSLAVEGAPLELFVFDTRAAGKSLKQELEQAKNDSIQLIIGYTDTVS